MKLLSYGPFHYEHQSDSETIRLFKQFENARPRLEHGVGVYIFGARHRDGMLRPYYVGKAVKHDIGGRIMSHLNKDKFARFTKGGRGLTLWVVVATNESGELLAKQAVTEAQALQIGQLEFALIGAAYSRNRDILNVHGRRSEPFLFQTGGTLNEGAPGSLSDLATLLSDPASKE